MARSVVRGGVDMVAMGIGGDGADAKGLRVALGCAAFGANDVLLVFFAVAYSVSLHGFNL